jgi:hypothetical protein
MSRAIRRRQVGAREAEPAYVPPTDEQLVNFATALIYGAGATEVRRCLVAAFFVEHPGAKQTWLTRHREM